MDYDICYRYYDNRMKNEYRLEEIKVEVTYRCPLACIHCSSDAYPSSPLEMSRSDCLRILEEALELSVRQVAFSGGEPLLWEPLGDAVELASKGNIELTVYTSGNAPDFAAIIGRLASAGLQRVIFSIFGATQKKHKEITRVHSSLQRTREAIATSIESGLNAELHFVPLSNNYQDLEAIAQESRDWGISQISVLRFVPQGRGSLIIDRTLNRLQNLQLKRNIEDLRSRGFKIRTGSPFNFLLLNEQPSCAAGMNRVIIGPDLRIYPCDAFKQVKAEELVGTLQYSTLEKHSLLDCWNHSIFLNAVREYLTTPFAEPCLSCKALDRCLSGCLAQKVVQPPHRTGEVQGQSVETKVAADQVRPRDHH